jgi:DNA-binding ferritin-like protein
VLNNLGGIMDKAHVSGFVGTLLHSATVTHIMHFQATGAGSFAAHMALNTYYEEIPGLVDSLAESIQGAYELITGYPASFPNTRLEPLAYMQNLAKYVETCREHLPKDSEIQNEVDSIANLINTTIYKLRFLK